MNVRQAQRVRFFSCTRKRRFDLAVDAADYARQLNANPDSDHHVRRYQCCFGGDHFHVGRPPKMRTVATLALAIRVLGQGVPIRGTARR